MGVSRHACWREVALRIRLSEANEDGSSAWRMVISDLGKATIGLVVSVLLVVFLYVVEGRDLALLMLILRWLL